MWLFARTVWPRHIIGLLFLSLFFKYFVFEITNFYEWSLYLSYREKGRYRYAGQWKHGRMHGCGLYEINERPIYVGPVYSIVINHSVHSNFQTLCLGDFNWLKMQNRFRHCTLSKSQRFCYLCAITHRISDRLQVLLKKKKYVDMLLLENFHIFLC